jgi:CBS domain-containing protein
MIIDVFPPKKVICVVENSTIIDTLKTMSINRIKRVPVINKEKEIVGIITSTDIINLLQRYGSGDFLELKTVEVMNKKVLFVNHTDTIKEVIEKFKKYNIRGAPILNSQGVIESIVTEKDFIFLNDLWTKIDHVEMDENLILGEEIQKFLVPDTFSIWQASDFIQQNQARDLLLEIEQSKDEFKLINSNDIIKYIYLNIDQIVADFSFLQATSLLDIPSKSALTFQPPITINELRKRFNARGISLGIINYPGNHLRVIDERYLIDLFLSS